MKFPWKSRLFDVKLFDVSLDLFGQTVSEKQIVLKVHALHVLDFAP